jgi:cell division protein FtsN
MQRKDITMLATVGIITAVISFVVSGMFFNSVRKGQKVPTFESIPTSLPDLKNDPSYNYIFNPSALDPAQPVLVGGSQNNQPFSGSAR